MLKAPRVHIHSSPKTGDGQFYPIFPLKVMPRKSENSEENHKMDLQFGNRLYNKRLNELQDGLRQN